MEKIIESPTLLARRLAKESKGFTLVELIVVIVILGILAAIAVPALTGYIDKSRNQELIADGRNIMIAAQTVLVEEYAASDQTWASSLDEDSGYAGFPDGTRSLPVSKASGDNHIFYNRMMELVGETNEFDNSYSVFIVDDSNQILAVIILEDFLNPSTIALYDCSFTDGTFIYQPRSGWNVIEFSLS